MHTNGILAWYNVTSEFLLYVAQHRAQEPSSSYPMDNELVALDITSEEPHHGRVRLGEAQNRGPAEHERDSAQEEPCPWRTRSDEAGDAVLGSQDSITRGVQNLQLGDIRQRSQIK